MASYFSCAQAVHNGHGQSFEEIRVDDYIQAYTSTGKPPVPTQTPTQISPYPVINPESQVFQITPYEHETFYSIAAMPSFSPFSNEELRYHAYMRGHKTSPTPIPTITPSFPKIAPDAVSETPDRLITISSQPAFSSHSLEELRLACKVAGVPHGMDLTSEQILKTNPSTNTNTQPLSRPIPTKLF